MSVKEESEINVIKKASQVSVDLFNKYLKDQILDVVDADKKVKHIKLSEGLLFIYLFIIFIYNNTAQSNSRLEEIDIKHQPHLNGKMLS